MNYGLNEREKSQFIAWIGGSCEEAQSNVLYAMFWTSVFAATDCRSLLTSLSSAVIHPPITETTDDLSVCSHPSKVTLRKW